MGIAESTHVPHAKRIEVAAFNEALAHPAEDRQPITAAEILATEEV